MQITFSAGLNQVSLLSWAETAPSQALCCCLRLLLACLVKLQI